MNFILTAGAAILSIVGTWAGAIALLVGIGLLIHYSGLSK